MVFDACASFEGERHLKTRILVSSQAVLHTNNATIGTQNKENNEISQNKSIQKENPRPLYIATFEKKEGKRRWIKRQIHQLNTMQKTSIERVHTQITRSQSRAHHITRVEQKTSQSASIRCSKKTNQKRLAALPIKYTSYRKRSTGRERERQQRDRNIEGCRRRSQSTWKKTQKKHIHEVERREAERVNNPSKCAIPLMNKRKQQDAIHSHTHTRTHAHTQNTSDHLPTLDLTVHEQQWRNDEWSKNEYTERERSRDIKTEEDGGCKYHSSKKKKNRRKKRRN